MTIVRFPWYAGTDAAVSLIWRIINHDLGVLGVATARLSLALVLVLTPPGTSLPKYEYCMARSHTAWDDAMDQRQYDHSLSVCH